MLAYSETGAGGAIAIEVEKEENIVTVT